MALEGDLRVFRLPDILQVIAQQQKTGILTVQGDQDILAVSFLRGDVVAADALNQNFEVGLGEVLASGGQVGPEEFARLSEQQKSSGMRLADYLIDRDVLSRGELLDALRQLTYRLLLQVLRWRQGEFKFYSGDEVSYEEGIEPLPVGEVLMRSLGDLMGEGTLSGTLPHGFVAYERSTSSAVIKVVGRDGTPPVEGSDAIWVSADEQTLLERIDGQQTADAVARSTGMGEYRTLYGLFRLLQAGLVRPAGSIREATVVEPAPAPARTVPVEPFRTVRREEVSEDTLSRMPAPWTGRLLGFTALVLAVAYAALLAYRPSAAVLSFPWMREDRAQFERQQRVARAVAIDRAARTYFLLEGRYPDRLAELVERGLLPERLVVDPAGVPYAFRPDAISYVLETPRPSGMAVSETISGDFVVDPDFFHGLRDDEGNPLILLD